MNTDEYGEVVNGEDTYKEIAANLKVGLPVLIGWSDGHGAHLDILFAKGAVGQGPLQGGIRRTSDLLVSLMRRGAFGFEVDHQDTHSGYYGEKLNWSGAESLEALASLINSVKRLLV